MKSVLTSSEFDIVLDAASRLSESDARNVIRSMIFDLVGEGDAGKAVLSRSNGSLDSASQNIAFLGLGRYETAVSVVNSLVNRLCEIDPYTREAIEESSRAGR